MSKQEQLQALHEQVNGDLRAISLDFSDTKLVAAQQRLLDELAAKIQATRRYVDGCSNTLDGIKRETFNSGPARGKLIDDIKVVEAALARMARTVEQFGGRP